LETVFFAVVAILVLGRLYQVLGQSGDIPPRVSDGLNKDFIAIKPKINDDDTGPINEPSIINVQSFSRDEIYKKQWGDKAQSLIEIQNRDKSFDPFTFQNNCTLAYEAIINSYGKGDFSSLKSLVSPAVFAAFEISIKDRISKNKNTIDIVKLAEPIIVDAQINTIQSKAVASIDVEFNSTLVSSGEAPNPTHEIWTFERELGSKSPIWLLVAVDKK
jgi:predicted lipid-binding transport protein (Tim44 family)